MFSLKTFQWFYTKLVILKCNDCLISISVEMAKTGDFPMWWGFVYVGEECRGTINNIIYSGLCPECLAQSPGHGRYPVKCLEWINWFENPGGSAGKSQLLKPRLDSSPNKLCSHCSVGIKAIFPQAFSERACIYADIRGAGALPLLTSFRCDWLLFWFLVWRMAACL